MLLGAREVATEIGHYCVQQMQESKTVGAVFAKGKVKHSVTPHHPEV
jgi:hypothetical protein